MTFLAVEKRIFNAHFPRSDRTSTIRPFDELQIAANIYTDPRPETQHVRDARNKKDPAELINIVFLHAVGFVKENWEIWAEMFFDKYGDSLGTVLAFDSVNHGESYVLNRHKLGLTVSWEDAGRDVLKILRELNIKSNVVLIGHSMGGASALQAAAFERRVIDSVITIEPVAYLNPRTHTTKPGRKALVTMLEKINKYIQDKFPDQQAYEKYMARGGVARTVHPRIRDELFRYGRHVEEDGTILAVPPRHAQMSCYISSYLSTRYINDQMKTIDCEVCHVIGAAATWNPPESVKSIREGLPNVVAVDIENGQHLVAMERPEDTFNAIVPFFEKRAKAIEQRVKKEEGKIETFEQADEYYWGTFNKAKDLYTKGQFTKYDRTHRL